MRTVGTFQDVYEAAKNYQISGDTSDRPMNPVIRRENGRWILESSINSAENSDFEVTLEAFDSYFWEGYPSNYVPSNAEIDDFVSAHQAEDPEND